MGTLLGKLGELADRMRSCSAKQKIPMNPQSKVRYKYASKTLNKATLKSHLPSILSTQKNLS
jgi:hypothetical protein